MTLADRLRVRVAHPERALGRAVHGGHDRDPRGARGGRVRAPDVRRGGERVRVPRRRHRFRRCQEIGALQRRRVDGDAAERGRARRAPRGVRDAGDENPGGLDQARDQSSGVAAKYSAASARAQT